MAKAKKAYAREALLKSERFSHIQRDFLSALLPNAQYTLDGAQKVIDDFFNTKRSDE